MPPTKPFDLRFFTRRLRRLSVVTAILAVLIPIRFEFDYNLADGVFLAFVLGSYDLTYRRERRRAMQADQSTYLKWRLAGSFGFLLLVSVPPIIAAILGFPPDSFFPYYCVAAAGFWTGIIAGEWHWRWKHLEKLSGEERGRYWSRYNDALFYTIPF
jgi:hypothetical protein